MKGSVMSQGSGMFREQALAALSAQEDFNQRSRILGPGRWMWVLGVTIIVLGFAAWSVFGTVTVTASGSGILTSQGGLTEIVSTADGTLATSLPAPQEAVQSGIPLAVVRGFDGLDHSVTSVVNGTMVQESANIGDAVTAGQRIGLVQPEGPPVLFQAFVPLVQAKSVQVGDRTIIEPATVNERTYGGIIGSVTKIGQLALDQRGISSLVESESLAQEIASRGPVVAVEVSPTPADTATGFAWTTSAGPSQRISLGTPATVSIETEKNSLITIFSDRR